MDRLIVDEDYNIVDTETGEPVDFDQMFNLVNKLWKEKKESIEYTELGWIIEEVCEPYRMMFGSGIITFSELAVMENILLKLNARLREDKLDLKGLIEENEELKEKIKKYEEKE